MLVTKLRWIVIVTLVMVSNAGMAQSCHYRDWRWNVAQKRVVQPLAVAKDYSELSPEERDKQSGCSVCAEDQQAIKLDGLPVFSVCKKYAAVVHDVLEKLIWQGEKIYSVIGYRVGRTRGDLDAQGNRSGFSNHSYGVAIDINTEHNGLYGNCVRFGPQCQLLRAGPWRPGGDPYSLQQNGSIVKTLKQAGFKWGGEIEGQQKDFMHFSLTGY
jgi:D-alanyl-D-alanine carboxypeptidase